MRLKAVQASKIAGAVYEEGFEAADHGWSIAEGIEASFDAHACHGGRSSLLLTGVQQGAWNYASHQLKKPVMPGGKYRLSCWLNVETVEPSSLPPYLKIGLTDQEGRWLTNFHTQTYDTAKPGTWQHLEAVLETPLDTARGHLALERGAKDEATRIRAWIDDVHLELLESP